MNIHEVCDEFNLSLGKARRMEKRGVLRLDGSTDRLDPIRDSLAKGTRLTAAQLVELIDGPGAILDLGKYASKAEEQIAALGNVQARFQVAPPAVTAYILDAAKGEPEAVAVLMNWIKSILPAEPVRHAYIATRLLLGIPANIREFDVPRIPRVLLNVRRHAEFAGWWRTEKHVSRIVTVYQKGAQKGFDL